MVLLEEAAASIQASWTGECGAAFSSESWIADAFSPAMVGTSPRSVKRVSQKINHVTAPQVLFEELLWLMSDRHIPRSGPPQAGKPGQ